MEQGFITLFISSSWCDWKTELDSTCLRLLIIKEVKCKCDRNRGFARSLCWPQSVHALFPLSPKWGENRYCAVSKEWEQWLWICDLCGNALVLEVESPKFCRVGFLLPLCTGKWREGVQAQSAPLLISLFIFLWALFHSFFPTLCSFSDPKICLVRWFLHPVGSASSTYAWTPFLMNSVSFSENPPLITLVPVLAFHWLKNACELP